MILGLLYSSVTVLLIALNSLGWLVVSNRKQKLNTQEKI